MCLLDSRIIKHLCATICFLFLCGCASSPHHSDEAAWRENNGKLKVLTTLPMIHDLVRLIGGEKIDSISLIRGELDPHSYELVKGDDEKFASASLIFYNGLGLEHGLSLRQNLENNPKAIPIGDVILKETPQALLRVDGQLDPHIWMDIKLWMRTVDPIVAALSEKDPAHAIHFKERGEELKKKMLQTDAAVYKQLQSIPAEKRYLVTSHDAFHYFTRHYLAAPEEIEEDKWAPRCAAPEGLAPDSQLSVTDLQEIILHITRYKVAVLFPESNVSKDSLRKILHAAREKGCNVRLSEETLYGDSMGPEGYLNMITHNSEVISHELTRK